MTDAFTQSTALIGSFGSTFRQIRVPPDAVPDMAARIDWNALGRRVIVDPVQGLIAWMAPSSPHETFARNADKVAEGAGALLGLRVKALGGTRWKQRPEDPPNTGIEPDACFYVGLSAEGWYQALKAGGTDAALVFEAGTPPDLVVEIEWTQIDRDKAVRYAELGATELWRAERSGDSVAVDILDLQATGGPAPSATGSMLFPGIDACNLPRLLELANQGEFREMETLLGKWLAPPERDPPPKASPFRPDR